MPTSDDGAKTRRALEDELALVRKKKERLRAEYRESFEHAGVGIAHVSPTGRFLDANKRFCEMLGRKRAALAKLNFQDVTFEEDLPANREMLHRLLKGESPGYRMQKRYVRSNGELFWADLTVSALTDETGRPAKLISIVHDITRQKADEERLKYLMGEISHRTKNLVSVVQVLVRQAFASGAPLDQIRNELLGRLAGIAASQEALLHDFEGTAELHELVALQLALFLKRDDARVQVSGPNLELGSAAARAIGMALHELATNACKYGALSTETDTGTVSIEWSFEGEQFRMSWTERGGPPVRAPERRGFGRRLVEHLVAASTGGDAHLTFETDGIIWSLSAPMATVAGQ